MVRDPTGQGRQIVVLAGELLLEHLAGPLDHDQVAHTSAELLGRKGLGEVVLHTLAQECDPQVLIGPGGEHDEGDHGELGPRTDLANQLVPAEPRHDHVGHDQVGAQSKRLVKALLAIEGGGDPIVAGQRLGDESVHLLVVLDDQHQGRSRLRRRPRRRRTATIRGRRLCERSPVRPRALGAALAQCFHLLARDVRGVGRFRRRRRHRGARRGDERQGHAEARPAVRSVAEGDGPSMQRDELLDDRQPQARAADTLSGLGIALSKALEDRFPKLGAHAGTVVLDGEECAIPHHAQHAPYAAAVRNELEGVGEEVQEDTLQLLGVGLGRNARRRLDREGDSPLVGDRLEVCGGEADEPRQVHLGVVEPHLAGIDLGDVEQVVHVLEQRPGVAIDHLHVVTRFVCEVPPGQELLGWPQHQGQRRAKLVADVGEELRPELVELLDAAPQLLHLHRSAQRRDEVLAVDRLLDEIVGAAAQRLHGQVVLPVPRDQQGRRIRPERADLGEEREAVHPRHLDVADDRIVVGGRDPAERLSRGVAGVHRHRVESQPEGLGKGLQQGDVVVDDEDACRAHAVGGAGRSPGAWGSWIWNTAPPPGRLATAMVPPWSLMIP